MGGCPPPGSIWPAANPRRTRPGPDHAGFLRRPAPVGIGICRQLKTMETTTRNPLLSLKLSGMFLLRYAQRAFRRLLCQEPPRGRDPAPPPVTGRGQRGAGVIHRHRAPLSPLEVPLYYMLGAPVPGAASASATFATIPKPPQPHIRHRHTRVLPANIDVLPVMLWFERHKV
jgi:hypothetical protein